MRSDRKRPNKNIRTTGAENTKKKRKPIDDDTSPNTNSKRDHKTESQRQEMPVSKHAIKTRPISELTLDKDNQKNVRLKRKLNNDITIAHKKSKQDGESKEYVFKNRHTDAILSEIEAYCGILCKFIATGKYVPTVHAYFGEYDELVGSASQFIPNFKTNHENPLSEDDTKIDGCEIEHEQNKILALVSAVLGEHDADNSVLNLLKFKPITNAYSGLFAPVSNWEKLKKILYNFKNNSLRFSEQSLGILSNTINSYLQSFENDPETHDNDERITYLKAIIKSIEKLIALNSIPHRPFMTIEEFEEIDKKSKSTQDPSQKPSESIPMRVFDRKIRIKTKDLTNYRTVKGLATTLTTRYIFKEGDNHNCNMDKSGHIVDFDMTKFNISSQYKQLDFLTQLLRKPRTNTFTCSAYDVRHFPAIKDADFYFWPTKQIRLANVLIQIATFYFNYFETLAADHATGWENTRDLITYIIMTNFKDETVEQSFLERMSNALQAFIVKIKALLLMTPEYQLTSHQQRAYVFELLIERIKSVLNDDSIVEAEDEFREQRRSFDKYFREKDNEAYKSLSTHPVFIYHKFKTFLKYLLTDAQMYQSLSELYIDEDIRYPNDSGQDESLRTVLVNDESARIKEIRDVLIKMPEFKAFLTQHGQFAFQRILEEFADLKQKYSNKLAEKPFYEKLVNAIDMEEIEARYLAILHECGVIQALSPQQANTGSISRRP